MVCLASRPYGGYFRNLGRETYLAPVIWEDGWPIVSPGTGKLEEHYPLPDIATEHEICEGYFDHFDSTCMKLEWNTLRTPRVEFWSLTERSSHLRLKLRPERIGEETNPSFWGRRQQHIDFSAATMMEFKPKSQGETAGIALIQNDFFHYRFEYIELNGAKIIRLVRCNNKEVEVVAEKPFEKERVYLKVSAVGQDYSFFFGESETVLTSFAENVDGRILSTDIAGGFVGTYIGLFASSNGAESNNHADFDWFSYSGK